MYIGLYELLGNPTTMYLAHWATRALSAKLYMHTKCIMVGTKVTFQGDNDIRIVLEQEMQLRLQKKSRWITSQTLLPYIF
jgi:hypothetical protein